jgi:hypothetical protein
MTHDRVYEPDVIAVMSAAVDDAWAELASKSEIRLAPEEAGIRRALALRILAAVSLGQKDSERLKTLACQMFGGGN